MNPTDLQSQNEIAERFATLKSRLVQNKEDCSQGIGVVDQMLDLFCPGCFHNEERVDDVLRALPMINRYTGQTLYPYSVAQHSMVLTHWAATEGGVDQPHLLMAILLHDAAEAFIGDIIRPIKRMINNDIRLLEDCIMAGLMRVVVPEPELLAEIQSDDFQHFIHKYDTALAATEARVLQRNDILPHIPDLKVMDGAFDMMAWGQTNTLFRNAYNGLALALVNTPEDATDTVQAMIRFR